MRLLFTYPFCSLGGVESVFIHRAKGLSQLGHDVRVLFTTDVGGADAFTRSGVQTWIAEDKSDICARVKTFAPDAILHTDNPGLIESLSELMYPSILEVHTTYIDNLRYLNTLPLDRLAGVICPSEQQRRWLIQRYPSLDKVPTRVVHNPISEKFLQNCSTATPKRPIVGWVGRLDDQKNWLGFVNLAERIAQARPNAQFWLVGGLMAHRDTKSQFVDRILSSALAERFCWLPAVPYDLMPRIYAAIGRSGGCVVSTSVNESFGMVAIEALAQSCACVLPAVGGFVDIAVGPLAQLLYQPGARNTAADAVVQRLLDSEQLRTEICHFGRNMVQERFAAIPVAASLVQTVQELILPAFTSEVLLEA